jgi:hypothetical protein
MKRRGRIVERGLGVCVLAQKSRHLLGFTWKRRDGEDRQYTFTVGDNSVDVSASTAEHVARVILDVVTSGRKVRPEP